MTAKPTFTGRVARIASSNYFFWGVIALLMIQALWIATSGRYPMAFDEDFHLGLIKLYTHHISPFWDAQPSGTENFGALIRDPSYLYHYLMSFPYRLISAVTDSLTAQVVALRCINIALFASGLVLWRQLMLKTKASKALVNTLILIFVLLPVVPLLAAQINYDNLFIPVVALSLLLTADYGIEVSRYKRVNTGQLLKIGIVAMTASLIKYAFLPLLLALAIYIVYVTFKALPDRRKLLVSIGFGWTLMTRATRWLLVAVLLLLSCLFAERYGLNIIRYHEPVPDCAKVLTVEQCSAYGPWVRNYIIKNNKTAAHHSSLSYAGDWFSGMWFRTYFAVDGPTTQFETRGPLVIPAISGIVFALFALFAVVLKWRVIWRVYNRPVLLLFALTSGIYVLLLWLDGYRSFIELGDTVAINGRYLLPISLMLFTFGGLGIVELLKTKHSLKVTVGCLAVLCLLWGGGSMTYVLRSRDAWYWDNAVIRHTNYTVRTTAGPLVPGYRNPTQFMSQN